MHYSQELEQIMKARMFMSLGQKKLHEPSKELLKTTTTYLTESGTERIKLENGPKTDHQSVDQTQRQEKDLLRMFYRKIHLKLKKNRPNLYPSDNDYEWVKN